MLRAFAPLVDLSAKRGPSVETVAACIRRALAPTAASSKFRLRSPFDVPALFPRCPAAVPPLPLFLRNAVNLRNARTSTPSPHSQWQFSTGRMVITYPNGTTCLGRVLRCRDTPDST